MPKKLSDLIHMIRMRIHNVELTVSGDITRSPRPSRSSSLSSVWSLKCTTSGEKIQGITCSDEHRLFAVYFCNGITNKKVLNLKGAKKETPLKFDNKQVPVPATFNPLPFVSYYTLKKLSNFSCSPKALARVSVFCQRK